MAFQLPQSTNQGTTGNYWVLISAQINRFPLSQACSTIVYGLFLNAAAYQAGDQPMNTQSITIPAALASSINTNMIATLESFLASYESLALDGVTEVPGFFYGAQTVS